MSFCNILLTSSGRRVELIELFRTAYQQLDLQGKIVTADMSPFVATAFVSDAHILVPPVTSPDYIRKLLETCRQYKIQLIVPLIDWELSILAQHREEFLEIGTQVAVSSRETCDLCFDKRETARYLSSIGVQVPKTYDTGEIKELDFPVFLKPYNGSASYGTRLIHGFDELDFFAKSMPEAMFQEYIIGREYALDGFVSRERAVISMVPRRQFEARSGEVSKGMTERNPLLIELGTRVLEGLPDASGCFTIDCILTDRNEVYFLDINPRFGGGTPLSIRSGANFPRWLLEDCLGLPLHRPSLDWRDSYAMLRYDGAIYFEKGDEWVAKNSTTF